MSTDSQARHGPWLAIATGILLLGSLPGPARAESESVPPIPLPPAQYVSLPANDRIKKPGATGSLPKTSPFGARTLSGFHSLVAQGTIILRKSTPTDCLPGDLRAVLADVAARFGPVSIQSTHRTSSRNRRAGGARYSLHLSCRAIDFRIRTRASGVIAYLHSRSEVGGIKMYPNGLIHIDNGSRRTW